MRAAHIELNAASSPRTPRRESADVMPPPNALVDAALTNDECRGCAPAQDKRLEAYVLLWAVAPEANVQKAPQGNTLQREQKASGGGSTMTKRGFAGLAVAVASIRQYDTARPVVIMSIAPDPALTMLASRFPRVEVRRVPQILASRIRNAQCRRGVKSLMGKHALPGTLAQQNSTNDKYLLRRSLEGLQMFTKLNVWSLTDFTRVLYMDTDVMLTRSVERLWSLHFLPHEAAAAAPTLTKGHRSSPNHRVKRCEDYRSPRSRTYNAGVFLARPNQGLYGAWLAALDNATWSFPCSTDQALFNVLMAAHHIRCIGHSFNCYDPKVVTWPMNESSAARAARFHCGDVTVMAENSSTAARGRVRSPADSTNDLPLLPPHILHYATNSKPWLGVYTQLSYYQRLWHRVHKISHSQRTPGS